MKIVKSFNFKLGPLALILIGAFLIRIVIAFLGEHGDVINYYYWAKDIYQNGLLGFYDRTIANAMRPTYPPVTSYIFWLTAFFHLVLWKLFWFLNLTLSLFPSNLIFWLESAKGWYLINKLPAILSDLAIIYLLYLFAKGLYGLKAGLIAASCFAFSIPFWYNSALWGQTDSIYALPMLAAFFALSRKKLTLAICFYTLSILTKPTGLFAFPIFLFFWFKQITAADFFKGILAAFLITIGLYLPFHPNNLIPWIISFYNRSLGGELSYIVANSFNVWALIFGFDNKSDYSLFLNIPAFLIGSTLFLMILYWIFYQLLSAKKINTSLMIYGALLSSFLAFLILPRMHERYFYPTLLLLALLAGFKRNLFLIFVVLSLIHFLNLYNFFWLPDISFMRILLSNHLVINFLIVLNLIVFFILMIGFRKEISNAKV